MKNCTHRWPQSGHFFSKLGHFFPIFKKGQGRSPPPPSPLYSRAWKCGLRKFGWILNFDSLLTWMITYAVFSAMRSMISWWVNFTFLSLFITFRMNVRMSTIPSPCSFFFDLHLEWSLNLSTDKNQFVYLQFVYLQFVYLRTCVPLYLVCRSNFLQLDSTVCRNAQK